MFCLEIWYFVKYSTTVDAVIQYIFKRNYEFTVEQEIHISRLEIQR